ncbi:hypothetical protein NDU88_006993 [Pleurodeles waltl]|uniref:Uncharacterized protein n=1 Tax=Pleurodeles waltl TaxID=8319 RepID=A0AAV7M1N5_PLEWA|nr:hypothetical protein NDU88_006993 [Pleurodeles waltl]
MEVMRASFAQIMAEIGAAWRRSAPLSGGAAGRANGCFPGRRAEPGGGQLARVQGSPPSRRAGSDPSQGWRRRGN